MKPLILFQSIEKRLSFNYMSQIMLDLLIANTGIAKIIALNVSGPHLELDHGLCERRS